MKSFRNVSTPVLCVVVIAFCISLLSFTYLLYNTFFSKTPHTAIETINQNNEPEQASNNANTSNTSEEPEKAQVLVPYNGSVQHIFFHPLIAYPKLAFDNDSMSRGYNDWFVTVKEFERIIGSLYKKNFILIDINSTFEVRKIKGRKIIKKRKLMLPKGKKPLIISIDDLNYYEYMIKNGNVHKLVLDSEGNVAACTETRKASVISHNNEIVPVLDEFVKKHKDFSFQGAKGVIALTGYEGVLGYRTIRNSPDKNTEREKALAVIKRLKETGWTFASHSYGHLDVAKSNLSKLKSDTKKWRKEVESLTGSTGIYVYPYGSRVLPEDPKYKFLVKSGFHMLCAVGSAEYTKFEKDSVMVDRRHMDGYALILQARYFNDLFNAKKIIDTARPKKYRRK